jgi:hypothetical protein
MVGILRAKAGWLSGVNNLNVVQFLPFIDFYLNTVYRYICWVNRANIQRRVCLRRRKHCYYMKNKRKNWEVSAVRLCELAIRDLLTTALQGISFTLQT